MRKKLSILQSLSWENSLQILFPYSNEIFAQIMFTFICPNAISIIYNCHFVMGIIREHVYFEMSNWKQLCQHNFISSNVVYSIQQIIPSNTIIQSLSISLFHLSFHVQFNGFFIHNLFLEIIPPTISINNRGRCITFRWRWSRTS